MVYNTSNAKFEIHNTGQIGSTYCLTLPFEELDERCLIYIHQTKSENIENILVKIENDNKLRESADKTSTLSNIYDNIADLRS